ncbi:hypothetical protein B296_00011427 [Ensete ventricosum]|uniref:Uncharacterized protein n=1 Tax=Ensete ventricosum TaxID=4639 RepID=A0A427AG37_ENSVE|nr:hypothetical protein B296_00011427 [Ensete ventricosum]
MSQERPFGNSRAEHRLEPNHSQPTEEVTTAAPTPNHFWRMMIDPGFPSPASNLTLFVVTAEAFLGLTSQVKALTVTEAHAASPTTAPTRSQSRSCDSVQIGPDLDTLSSDTANSLREQVHQVHRRLDEVQKEILKTRGEIGESSKGGSSFTPEIQGKPLPATFRLPTLEPYDGSGDPTEHIAAFNAEMALYDMSDMLMCRAFPTTLRDRLGPGNTIMTRRNAATCNIKSKTSSGADTCWYVCDQSSLPDSRSPRDSSPQPKGPVEKQIDVIFGGPASGSDSSSARKAYAQFEVGKRPAHYEDLDITFKSGGKEYPCHDDALVISIRIVNAYVKRVMIDTGSSTDILYFDAF